MIKLSLEIYQITFSNAICFRTHLYPCLDNHFSFTSSNKDRLVCLIIYSLICVVKHNEIRDHIIHTASDLFYKNGYNLTGINQIIAEAGIAKATLYNHFSGKEDICVAYLQTKNATFLQDLAAFVKGKPEGKARIQAVVEFLVPFFHDEDFHGCWCVRTVAEVPITNEKIWAEIQLQKNKLLTYIKQLVKENLAGKSEGEIEKLAQFVYMIYEGAVSESYLHQNIWPIENGMEMLGLLLAKE